jgi:transcriptional antiterminator NusG
MKTNFSQKPQWFIITVIGGKEKSIVANILDRLNTYGYYGADKPVREIKIIEHEEKIVKKFSNDDPTLPKNLNNSKTTTWKTLPDGKYERTSLHITNKFPSYIFINMVYDSDIWYVIRNTGGVLGFIGSSGKGAKPSPISIAQYDIASTTNIKERSVKAYQINSPASIIAGAFKDNNGFITANTDDGVKIEIDFGGRKQEIDVKHGDFTIINSDK